MTVARLISAACACAALACAANITPYGPVTLGSSQATAVWYIDRYAPSDFRDASPYMGRSNVIAIGISAGDAGSGRPESQEGMFYNTQGRKYDITGGDGDFVEFALFIENTWSDAANGFVRSDLWTTMADQSDQVSAFPIIGFTNYGGAPRYRYWTNAGWTDLPLPVIYNAWTTFRIQLRGQDILYVLNGAEVASVQGTHTTQFWNVMLQAYNFAEGFGDPSDGNYTVHWAPTLPAGEVPEPGTAALFGCGALAFASARWLRRR